MNLHSTKTNESRSNLTERFWKCMNLHSTKTNESAVWDASVLELINTVTKLVLSEYPKSMVLEKYEIIRFQNWQCFLASIIIVWVMYDNAQFQNHVTY